MESLTPRPGIREQNRPGASVSAMQYVGLTKAAIGEIMNNSDLQTLLRRQGFTRLIISNAECRDPST